MAAAGTNVTYLGILSVGYLVLGILIDYLNANPWLRNKLVHGARRAFTSKDAVVRAVDHMSLLLPYFKRCGFMFCIPWSHTVDLAQRQSRTKSSKRRGPCFFFL